MSPKIIDDATREARERVITDVAQAFIREEGIGALTIDKIVTRVPYSKGTVYSHFSCKEDLITGLCNLCVGTLADLFRLAIDFNGSSREKMMCLGIAYMLHAQADMTRFMLVITAKTPSIRSKASESRANRHLQLEAQLMGLFLGVIEEAVSDGDLVIPPHLTLPQVAFSIWSMSFGTIALLQDNLERCSVRSELDLERELVNHANLLLDGLGWRPLTPDHDWSCAIEQCKQRVMPLVAVQHASADSCSANMLADSD
jgi:AcrR family transcriptional regulator